MSKIRKIYHKKRKKMYDSYSDVNILDTVLDSMSEEYMLNKFIDSIGTSSYRIWCKAINYRKKYDLYWINTINDKIKDIFDMDILQIYNISEDEIENSMKIFIDVLNSIHIDLPEILSQIRKKYGFSNVEDLQNNVNIVIKETRGKLKQLLRMMELDKIQNLIYICTSIFPVFSI